MRQRDSNERELLGRSAAPKAMPLQRTVELALELGQHEGDGLSCASGGGHDVQGSGAGAAQVPVGGIQQALVAGVRVGGSHHGLHDAEALVQHLRPM